jgi:hypothetical protein
MKLLELNNLILDELKSNADRIGCPATNIELGNTKEMPSILPAIWLFCEMKKPSFYGNPIATFTLFVCSSAENPADARIDSLKMLDRASRIINDMQLALANSQVEGGFDAYYSDFACSYLNFECYYEYEELL